MSYTLEGKRVWVAGHRGMVGSALVRRLERENPSKILKVTRQEVDLIDQAATAAPGSRRCGRKLSSFPRQRLAGSWPTDTYPADFLYDNLMIAANIIHACHKVGVEKLLFLGSSCIYPSSPTSRSPKTAC
jgi:GDP-L-fucose synthase